MMGQGGYLACYTEVVVGGGVIPSRPVYGIGYLITHI